MHAATEAYVLIVAVIIGVFVTVGINVEDLFSGPKKQHHVSEMPRGGNVVGPLDSAPCDQFVESGAGQGNLDQTPASQKLKNPQQNVVRKAKKVDSVAHCRHGSRRRVLVFPSTFMVIRIVDNGRLFFLFG